jgi:hypothetical protein
MIANMKFPAKQFNRSSMRALLPFIYDSLPLRMRAFHLVNPSSIAYYVVFPVIKQFLGRQMRLRLRAHYGGQAEIAQSLGEYRLFSNVLPVEIGGNNVVNRDAWLANRLMVEGELIRQCEQRHRLQQQEQPQQSEQSIERNLSGMGYNLADFEPDPIGAAGHDGAFTGLLAGHPTNAMARSGTKRGSEIECVYSDEVAQTVFTETGHELKKRRSENELLIAQEIEQDLAYDDFLSGEGFPSGEFVGGPPTLSPGTNNIRGLARPLIYSEDDAIQQAIASIPSAGTGDAKSTKKSKKKSKSNGKKSGDGKGGRQSDPRMIAAINAKMNDNSLPLREALEVGGFEFPPIEGRCAAATVLDSDGVSLAQRKNQLSRRLRQIKAEQAKKGNAHDGVEGEKAASVSQQKEDGASTSMKRVGSLDSFSDMMSNLPGIDDFVT